MLRVRRGKQYDLRPLIYRLKVSDSTSSSLAMTLAASPDKGTARPDEVLETLGVNLSHTRVTRTELVFDADSQL